ncbi:hypothetical protein O3P69_006245 [Scylla paramamosain]|uniref:Uncharacterized protein n=1 Tax=Scylla paramamosain TaxID=85552 RepID=A0AAW0U7X7_SCYPA
MKYSYMKGCCYTYNVTAVSYEAPHLNGVTSSADIDLEPGDHLRATASAWPPRGGERLAAGVSFILAQMYRSNLKAMMILPWLSLPFDSLEELIESSIICYIVPDTLLHKGIMCQKFEGIWHLGENVSRAATGWSPLTDRMRHGCTVYCGAPHSSPITEEEERELDTLAQTWMLSGFRRTAELRQERLLRQVLAEGGYLAAASPSVSPHFQPFLQPFPQSRPFSAQPVNWGHTQGWQWNPPGLRYPQLSPVTPLQAGPQLPPTW